jgi:hypothetical protein
VISNNEFYTIQLKQQLSSHITASIQITQNIHNKIEKKKEESRNETHPDASSRKRFRVCSITSSHYHKIVHMLIIRG